MKSEALLAKHIQKSCWTGVLEFLLKIHITETCTQPPPTLPIKKKKKKKTNQRKFTANRKCEDMVALKF